MATPATAPKLPAGVTMLLHALNIKIDPEGLNKAMGIVETIGARIEAIERNQKTILANQVAILALIGKEQANGKSI